MPLADATSTDSKRKSIFLLICLAIFISSLVPFPMVVARECTVVVVDGAGKPWPEAKIDRGWAYGSSETLEEKFTGSDGIATFEKRKEWHPLLARCIIPIVNILVVHGGSHVSDEYLVDIPETYTAEIDSDASFKWVYVEGHFAKVDLGSLPRSQHCQVKFILKKVTH